MKILYISKADLPDFQNDMLFHGLRSLFGESCEDLNEMWYMYEDTKSKYWNKLVPENGKSYGRGFTLYGRLKNLKIDRSDILSKIKNKFYDKIIYGSIFRCLDYIDIVQNIYEPKDIIFIDGEDHTNLYKELLTRGVYYKRELVYEPNSYLKPINFSIPKECVVENISEKIKEYGTIIPGDFSTYIFEDEESYNNDYKKSYYGVTFKKGGWDCLRHYEILMNGCVPYFPNLEYCPKHTMKLFPKNLIIENNKYLEKNGLSDFYYDHLNKLLKYTREYLTTEHIAKKILYDN